MRKLHQVKSHPAFKLIAGPKSNRTVYIICLLYLILISAFMLWHRLWFSPDQFFLVAILAATFIGGLGRFLKDWVPFLVLFLGYEYLRGLAPILNSHVHITPMITADTFLFGFVPAVRLQELLFHPGSPQWYDFLASILYMAHFIVPMTTAFVFWLVSKKTFREFTLALVVLSFAAFTTYILYPAMPPWLAANNGYLPPLQKVLDLAVAKLGHPVVLPTLYSFFRGDEVAAMPSLHAAFPLLVLLFSIRQFKWLGLVVLPYLLGVWFAVIYLGEHYVIDVVFGALYAAVVFWVVINRQKLVRKAKSIRLNRSLLKIPLVSKVQ